MIDPARVTPANQVPTDGDRFVGVEFDRADTAPASPIAETEEEYADTELTVVARNGVKIHGIVDGTTFGSLVGCAVSGAVPDSQLGAQLLHPGQKTVDCVVFQLPKGAALSKITYQDNDTDSRPGGSPSGSVATWTVGTK
ncbi:hypothetical protein [uncultured Jatrophihabitans sp.]|uniref:hypothetical protein n=1 Tax=uncultured Jatrophihabitans sp. TaxID=1610747 RepID=UPI0035CC1DFD